MSDWRRTAQYTLAGSGRNRAGWRRLRVAAKCAIVAGAGCACTIGMLPLSGHLWQVATGAAHDPDAYCAADTATTAKEARWGYHRRAVRADRSRGRCFDNARDAARLTVVVAHFDEDLSWVSRLVERKFRVVVYHHAGRRRTREHHALGDAAAPRANDAPLPAVPPGVPLVVLPNVGDEALPYASFVNASYDALTDHVAFVHGERASAHSPMDVVERLAATCVLDGRAYLDLNGWPSCADRLYTTEGTLRCMAPRSARPLAAPRCPSAAPGADDCEAAHARVSRIWASALAPELGAAPPAAFVSDCCAQFVASRAALRGRSRAFWGQLAAWTASPGADWPALEFSWRTIVGAPPSDWRGGAPCGAAVE